MSYSVFCAVQINISRCGFISGLWRALTLAFPAALGKASHLDFMLLIEALKKVFLRPWFVELFSDWLLEAATLHDLTPFQSSLNAVGASGSQLLSCMRIMMDKCWENWDVLKDPVHCCMVLIGSHSHHSRIHIVSPVCPDLSPRVLPQV